MTRFLAILALALAGPELGASAQESDFESADYGVRLKIPKGWNVDGTRQAGVIVKLTQPGESAVKPELLVYSLQFADPITHGQYKEQLRHYLQKAYKDPRMIDDRPAKAGGKDGFILGVLSRGANDALVASFKGVFEITPRRFLGVDGAFPQGQEAELTRVYDALLSSVELIPRRQPIGAEEGIKLLGEALKKLSDPFTPPAPEEVSIFLGEREVGSQSMAWRATSREGSPGIELDLLTKVDLGEEGHSEAQVKGFLSSDLQSQWIEISDLRSGKDKRVQSFNASASLLNGEVRMQGRINGEKSSAVFKAPQLAVFSEFADLLQRRLLSLGKGFVLVPTVQAFDHDPVFLKVESAGLHKMRVDDVTTEVQVIYQGREDVGLVTYWYDADRHLVRITNSGQGAVFRRKK